jgi:endogenous inhibitor of DNA gyrase (YacG/DUF329 family)
MRVDESDAFLLLLYALMKCPLCGTPTAWQDNPTRPFCSERCKLLDFGRWADEEYRVPAEETPASQAEEAEPHAATSENSGA